MDRVLGNVELASGHDYVWKLTKLEAVMFSIVIIYPDSSTTSIPWVRQRGKYFDPELEQ